MSEKKVEWDEPMEYLKDDRFADPGTDCSCPNILPLGNGKNLLLFFSHNQGPKYYIGSSDVAKGRFNIEKYGRMIYGPAMRGSLHAPTGFIDPRERCIGMWNVFECLREESRRGDRNGVVSLPRQLALRDEKTISGADSGLNLLCIEPIEELKTLRFNPVKMEHLTIPANAEKVLAGVQGRAMELEAVIEPQQAQEVGLRILRSPNGEELTTISLSMHAYTFPYKTGKRNLSIDVSRASLSPKVASRSPEIGPLFLEDGEPLRLRVFIDRSIIEIFANGRQCLTLRAYPTRPDSTGVSVFARGGEAKLISLDAWQMRSIWPELKAQEGR